MSHWDDIEHIACTDTPKMAVGTVLLLILIVIAIVWAVAADADSERVCKSWGEKYVDSRSAYTLCERTDGTVVRRNKPKDKNRARPATEGGHQ